MVQTINLPDGNIGQFPDGMAQGDIEGVLQKQYNFQSQKSAAQDIQNQANYYNDPSLDPNFQNLSKQEQLQRISLAANSPGNTDIGGGAFLTPTQSQSTGVQTAANIGLNAMVPEYGAEQLAARVLPRALSYGSLNAGLGAAENPDNPGAQALVQGSFGGALGAAAPEIWNLGKLSAGYIKNALSDVPKTSINTNPLINSAYKPQVLPSETSGTQFVQQPVPIPSYLTQAIEAASPTDHAEQLMQNISKGESPEQAAQATGNLIKNSYDKVKGNAQQDYNSFFKAPADGSQGIPEGTTLGNMLVYAKSNPIAGTKPEGAYIDLIGAEKDPYGSENIDNLHDAFMDNPTLENAHKLQSGLGNEIGNLKDLSSKSGLDQTQRNQLSLLNNARGAVQNDMYSTMDDIHPSLTPTYQQLGQNWKNNVEPYHSDPVLRQISLGNVKNPSASKITGIFGSPEPSIQKVASDIGSEGTNRIAYLGMNKLPEENTPANLIAGNKSLQKKGLSNYVSPEIKQSFADLRTKIQGTQAAKATQAQQNAFARQVQSEIANPSGIVSQVNPFSSAQALNPQAESNAIQRAGIERYNALLNPEPEQIVTGNAIKGLYNKFKKFGGHAASALIGHKIL